MTDTAIFDLDGRLVDSNYQHAIAWYRAFRDRDLTPPIWRIHRAIGMGGDRLVAAVTTAEDAESTKPAPDLLQVALAKVGDSDGVCVGDSTWDFLAAGRLGPPGLAVRTGGFSVQELRESAAAEVFDSLPKLTEALPRTALGGS